MVYLKKGMHHSFFFKFSSLYYSYVCLFLIFRTNVGLNFYLRELKILQRDKLKTQEKALREKNR